MERQSRTWLHIDTLLHSADSILFFLRTQNTVYPPRVIILLAGCCVQNTTECVCSFVVRMQGLMGLFVLNGQIATVLYTAASLRTGERGHTNTTWSNHDPHCLSLCSHYWPSTSPPTTYYQGLYKSHNV